MASTSAPPDELTTILDGLSTILSVMNGGYPDSRPRWPSRPPSSLYNLTRNLFIYVPPILIFGGTIGNLLSFAVMLSPVLRTKPSSLIYSILALTDTAVLYTGLLRYWISEVWDIDLREQSSFSCKTHLFITYLLGHLSACYLMLLTVERTISVYFPLHCKMLCSKRRMVLAIVISTLVETGFNMHYFFTQEWRQGRRRAMCMTIAPHFDMPWKWIDSSLASFIPFTIIFIGNLLIVSKLYLSQKKKKGKMQVNTVNSTSSTTVILVVVSTCFLLLTLPSCIYFLGQTRGIWPRTTNTLFYRSAMLLYYTNNTINFWLYFVSGAKFRQALKLMLPCSVFFKGVDEQKNNHSSSKITLNETV